MRITILSLFPEYFKSPFSVSIVARAIKGGLLHVDLVDIRDYATDKHRKVDDRPFGGGPGMVMKAEPVVAALRAARHGDASRAIYLSPQGRRLDAALCRHYSGAEHLILLCGHYEGVDERALELEVDEEVSIGDFVLPSGCGAAVVFVEAVARFIPGVVGNEEGPRQDSFEEGGLLDCPHYTMPRLFEGREVPPVLLGGDHGAIAAWRRQRSLERTRQRRPDLLQANQASPFFVA